MYTVGAINSVFLMAADQQVDNITAQSSVCNTSHIVTFGDIKTAVHVNFI